MFDKIVLLLTGLVAAYVIYRLNQDNKRVGSVPPHNAFYIMSFLVLLVAGLLLIAKGEGALGNPLVVVVAYLIPLGLSLGLVWEFYTSKGMGYMIFGLIGLIGIAITRYAGSDGLGVFVLAFFHSIAGLLIFFLPIFIVKGGRAPGAFIMVTIGGFLIGVGGIALAFLKAGSPILSAETIFLILEPILLLMALAFCWGFTKKILTDKNKA